MTIDTQEALRLLDELRHAGQCAAMYESDGRNGHARKEWERYDAAEKQLRALLSAKEGEPNVSYGRPSAMLPDDALPCDVQVAPRTIIRRGCKVSTLLTCIALRNRAPEESRSIEQRAIALRDVEKEKGNG